MYADAISLEQHETGENNAGAYLGYYSFTYNLSNSVALFVMGILLDFIKFDSTLPIQALSVQKGLGSIVFCGCSIAISIAIIIFSKYNVKRADVLKAQLELKRKKETDKVHEK
jgi:Na+/melibiose symporter-like transporter